MRTLIAVALLMVLEVFLDSITDMPGGIVLLALLAGTLCTLQDIAEIKFYWEG